jgi:hypothetical protein
VALALPSQPPVAILLFARSEATSGGNEMPEHIKLYGFFFDINSGKLTEVGRDIPN